MRSDASIATSVPVPIARPRSACARAGASLTPSPTIATTRPSPCRRAHDVGLVGRAAPRRSPRRCPTSAATARAVAALSPVSSTGRRPRPRSRRDRLGAGRLDRVRDHQQAAHPRRPRRRRPPCARRPARSSRAALERRRRASRPHSASSAGRPTTTGAPSTTPSTPRPSRLAKPSRRGQRRPARRGPPGRWRGRSGARRRPPARRPGAGPRRGPRRRRATTSASAISPVVTVPVLSSTMVSTRRVDSRISGP